MSLFDKERKQIRRLIKESTQALAKHAYRRMINTSPVWSGSYLASHRIGLGSESMESPTMLPSPHAPGANPSMAFGLASARLFAIEKSKLYQPIIISNNIQHAMIVEKLGTKNNPSGWHVYRRAAENTKAHANEIIKKVERKVMK